MSTIGIHSIDKNSIDKNSIDNSSSNIIEFYNNNINLITPFEFEKLQDYKNMDDELIIYAMQKAVTANAKNFNYIDSILKNWKAKGYTKLIQAQNEDTKFKNNKNKSAMEEFLNEHTGI